MSVFDRFEQNVKKVVDGAFSKAFKARIKPVDIASALRNAADDKAESLDRQRTITANVYTVHLAPSDFDEITQTYGAQSLAQELATGLQAHIHSQNYIVPGPVTVELAINNDQKTHTLRVSCTSKSSEPEQVEDSSLQYPMIDVDGQRYLLTRQTTVLGRGSEADIVVADQGVSRRHLELQITADGAVIASDLGSTNGTFVEGHQVPAATLVDGNTLTIGRTKITFWQAYSAGGPTKARIGGGSDEPADSPEAES